MLEQPTQLGEFQIAAVLGVGGSGTVYDATWGSRRVALKILHADLVSGERGRARFLAEAQRLQTIAHPSVVKVLAVGELPDGRPFLAMERLEGETLASVLARGAMPLAVALALFGELCAAVSTLHDQGLIHRDLKPENVFVVDKTHAVLLDFGIAKELEAPAGTTTIDGGVRGTPAYMAPERFFGQAAGVATDVYELAVTFYAMLAGRLPWDDVSDPEARLSPRSLVELAPVPSELDVEIRRAMSTRAQNRPASANALYETMRVAAGATSSTEPAASTTARMRSATDAKPWFAERQATTDRGKTPLAWAPADPTSKVAKRRRWPFVIGALAIVGVGGFVVWQLDNDDAPQTIAHDMPGSASAGNPTAGSALPATGSSDPWGNAASGSAGSGAALIAPVGGEQTGSGSADPWAADRPAPVEPPKLAQTGPELAIPEARKQLAAAITHVPADTRVLFAVSLVELRANEQFDDLLGKIKKQPMMSGFLASTPPCVGSVITGAQWAVFATKSLDDAANGTLIVRGRWTRADIEKCFADDATRLKMPDGKTMMQLRRVGWIDFLDDHTVYISVRDDLAAAQIHGLVARGSGPTPHTKELLARLPADRTLVAVIDGSGKLEWPSNYLPVGSDLTAWLRVGEYSDLEVLADTHSDAAAQKLVTEVKPQLDELFGDKRSEILGSMTVERVRTVMRIRGRLSSFLVAMIGGQLS